MTNAFKHALIPAAAVVFAVTALAWSGGAAQAQIPLQDGPNGVGGTVVIGGKVIGQDPDAGIRSNLYKNHDSQNGG